MTREEAERLVSDYGKSLRAQWDDSSDVPLLEASDNAKAAYESLVAALSSPGPSPDSPRDDDPIREHGIADSGSCYDGRWTYSVNCVCGHHTETAVSLDEAFVLHEKHVVGSLAGSSPDSGTTTGGPELAAAVADLFEAFGISGALCGVNERFNAASATEIIRFAAKIRRQSAARASSPSGTTLTEDASWRELAQAATENARQVMSIAEQFRDLAETNRRIAEQALNLAKSYVNPRLASSAPRADSGENEAELAAARLWDWVGEDSKEWQGLDDDTKARYRLGARQVLGMVGPLEYKFPVAASAPAPAEPQHGWRTEEGEQPPEGYELGGGAAPSPAGETHEVVHKLWCPAYKDAVLGVCTCGASSTREERTP